LRAAAASSTLLAAGGGSLKNELLIEPPVDDSSLIVDLEARRGAVAILHDPLATVRTIRVHEGASAKRLNVGTFLSTLGAFTGTLCR